MVLEALLSPIKAERRPWETFFIGIIYASFAVIVSLILFKEHASTIIIALTAMVSIPLIYGAIKLEEKKDLAISDEKVLIKEHGKALLVFVFLFLGFVAAFILWYIFLPESTTQVIFDTQLATIDEINNHITGNAINTYSAFSAIFFHNLKVLSFCLVFAFFYGFGAIFILTWNASVFAILIGSLIKSSAHGLSVAPLILLKYSLHGIPEMTGYFIGGLAGGIISIAIIRHDFNSKKFKQVLIDSVDLIILSVVVLLISAIIEVSVSPLII